MGILSEIFAELLGGVTTTNKTTVSKGASSPYGMADPFANTTAKKSTSSVKNVPISQQKTALEQHSHKHPANSKNSKIEKRPGYAGSLGKLNDEGCEKHADERYVQVSKPVVSASTITVSEMRKAVIMSEILGKPKSKR